MALELVEDVGMGGEMPPTVRPEPFEIGEHFWLRFPHFSLEYASEVYDRYAKHIQYWNESPYARAVFASYRAYHNMDAGTGLETSISIEEAGESGELLAMKINNYRGLIKHQLAMLLANKPAWEVQARTADAAASQQVPMATNLLDYVMKAGLIRKLAKQAEMAKPCASSFFVLGWDANAGVGGHGWYTSQVVSPWEMAHEDVREYDDATWWIWRTYENKWDWVTRYAEEDPEKAERIANLDQRGEEFANSFLEYDTDAILRRDGDRIAVLNVYARPTIACPQGRLSKITSDEIVLEDIASPWGDDVPIFRMCPAEFVGTAIPYADSWSLLAPAEALSAIVSIIMTRIDTCGVPNIAAPTGTELNSGDLGGNNLIEFPPGTNKPEALDLLHIPPELPQSAAMFDGILEKLSGINSVTRGQPAENISSGSMAALMQAMAIQYNSADEQAWQLNLEQVGTMILKIFKTMADMPIMVPICGESNQWTVSEFKKEDLSSIMRVSVKVTSALTKTSAFRADMADKLLQNKPELFHSAGEYLTIVETGQMQSMFKGPVDEETFIRAENERLNKGQPVVVSTWDNDQQHIRAHRCELNTAARYDQQRAQAINTHIAEHMKSWATKSRETPDILAALGQPPLPMAMAIGEQGRAMESMSMGVPPIPPNQAPPPQQVKQPNTEPAKAQPGPKPAPPGKEPSQAAPGQPKPAETPAGEKVV